MFTVTIVTDNGDINAIKYFSGHIFSLGVSFLNYSSAIYSPFFAEPTLEA
jgi:hypothetical protein